MQRSWKRRNVDLALLTTRIGDFFKERDFEAVKGQTPTGYQILAEGSPYFRLQGYVGVTIEGRPEDFAIKLDLCTKRNKRFRLPPSLLSMFGGGYFLLQAMKSDEAWMKLEKEFWQHMENAVLHLTNTAENKKELSKCSLSRRSSF